MTSNWKECKLLEIVDIIGGGTPKTSISEYWGGQIPWLSVKDFKDNEKYVYKTEKTITENGLKNSSTQLLIKNDIIISARGTIGELAIIPYPMAFNQSCYGIRAKKNADSNFLYYLLKNNINLLKHNTHGSVFDTITRETFNNIIINLPPLETQRKIAKVLSDIDDKIELNNKINENLEQQIKILYKNCFIENNNVVEISNLIDVRDGTHDSPKTQQTGKKLVTSKHLLKYGVDVSSANFISEEDYQKINERSLVATNDVLISMIGTVGIVSFIIENPVDFAVKNVGIYKTSQKNEFAYYIHCFLNSTKTQNYILSHLAGTTQKYISLSELRTLKINVPNKNQLDFFNELVKPMYDNLINNMHENSRLIQLRDTLLPKLMSGEIDVSNVDISTVKLYESACEFLKTIKNKKS